MRKVICTLALLALCAGAQSKVEWSKDERLIQGWFANNANTAKFIAWSKENLTQEQVNAVEALMFPDPGEGDKQVAMELMKLQMQQLNLEKDPSFATIYEGLSAKLQASREAAKQAAPVEADAQAATK